MTAIDEPLVFDLSETWRVVWSGDAHVAEELEQDQWTEKGRAHDSRAMVKWLGDHGMETEAEIFGRRFVEVMTGLLAPMAGLDFAGMIQSTETETLDDIVYMHRDAPGVLDS